MVINIDALSGGGDWQSETFSPTNGQTLFTLSILPSDSESVLMIINDATYTIIDNFTVVGSAVTWNNVAFTITTTDTVVIRYVI